MSEYTAPKNAVLSYPYEGGLYYLFSRENPSHPPPETGHPYHEALYGEDPKMSKNDAVNLMSLFDEILLPPADEFLPDRFESETDRGYHHSDLRVTVSNDWEFGHEASDLASKLLAEDAIQSALLEADDLPGEPQKIEFLLSRVIEQLRLALKHGAVIIGGKSTGRLAAEVWKLVQHDITEIGNSVPGPPIISLGAETFNTTALTWKCENVDALTEIRTSAEIATYAAKFRDALFAASNADDMNAELRRLMKEAMSIEAVSRKAKGAFETTGIASTMVGAIPVIGTAATLTGLGSFLGYRQAERAEMNHKWYLLGTKMREVDLQRILREA